MKKKEKLLIVASFPPKHRNVIGGIEKSSRILVKSEYLNDLILIKFDSSQISNPPPNLFIRFCLAIVRLIKFIYYLVTYKPDKVLIFCSDGPSAIEKGLMIFLARLLSIKSLIFPRAGNLITQTRNNKYFMSLVRFLFNRANFFLCQGPVWHKYAINDLRLDKSKVDIINNWTASKKLIEIGKKRIIKESDIPLEILFMGWLEKEKGINELINAFYNVQKKHQIKIKFIGDGSLRKKIELFRDKHNLYDNITITGWLNDNEVISNFKSSDIFILPSWQEGMPNSLIEALASGLPSIVSSVGSIPDFIENNKNGMLIKPKNQFDIEQALKKILNDFNLRKKLAKNSTKLSEKFFSEDKAISKLNHIIKNL
jgi:glycosyltransferase involved in cell wall biosynthesis